MPICICQMQGPIARHYLGIPLMLSKKLPSAIASSLPLARGRGGSLSARKEKSGLGHRPEKNSPPLRPSLAVRVKGGEFRSLLQVGFFNLQHPRQQLSEARVTQSAATGAPVAGDAESTPTTLARDALGIVTRRAETTYPRWLSAQHRARPEGERPVSIALLSRSAWRELDNAQVLQDDTGSGAPA